MNPHSHTDSLLNAPSDSTVVFIPFFFFIFFSSSGTDVETLDGFVDVLHCYFYQRVHVDLLQRHSADHSRILSIVAVLGQLAVHDIHGAICGRISVGDVGH